MREIVQALHDASALHGEFKRMLLTVGVVGVILCIAWVIQELGVRKSAMHLGWLGISCICLVGFGAISLIALGLL